MTEKVKIESFNKGKKVVSRPYLLSIEDVGHKFLANPPTDVSLT